MSIYAIIVLSIGVGICIYGIINKIIEITIKKTLEMYNREDHSIHPV